jgi:hypothetical protein
MKRYFPNIIGLAFAFLLMGAFGTESMKAAKTLQIVSCDTLITRLVGLSPSATGIIKNIGSKTIYLKVKLNIISVSPNHFFTICYGGACLPKEYTLLGYNNFPLGDSLKSGEDIFTKQLPFTCEDNDGNSCGTDVVEIIFYDSADTTNKVSFTTTFNIVPTSVNDINTNYSGLSIYPNPATDWLHIKNDVNSIISSQVEIFNCMSQKVYSVDANSGNEIILDLKDFENGVYIIKMKSGDNISTGKAVISK